MRGRKPKPASLQISEGDPAKRGVRKLRERLEAEPKATTGLPECPSHLKGRARKVWEFWVPELEIMELDRAPDAVMLEGACQSYSKAVEADLILDAEGLIIEESVIDKESGERIVLKRKKHPAVEVSNAAWRQVRAFCSEFGLSPVSRTRLSVGKRDEGEQTLAKILSAPREPRPSVN